MREGVRTSVFSGGAGSAGQAENTMVTLYILQSIKYGRMYIGITEKPALERLREHNQKKVRSTKAYAPYRLIKTEQFATKREARQRELQLKRSGLLRKRIKSTLPPSSRG